MGHFILVVGIMFAVHHTCAVILWQNMGLILQERGYLSITSDNFYYTFVVDIPETLPPPPSNIIICEDLFNVRADEYSEYLIQCHEIELMIKTMYTDIAKLATKT